MKLWLKGCPRCKGDVEVPRVPTPYDDPTCIQCGFYMCEQTVANLKSPKKVVVDDEESFPDDNYEK